MLEKSLHINVFELAGGALAMKTFTKDRENIYVLLKMDNTASIAYTGWHKITNSVTGGHNLWH